jgi:outer membrane protein assembly factor BamB
MKKNLFRVAGICLITFLICALLLPGLAFADDGSWPQFHNDAEHTGYSGSTAPDDNTLKWESLDIGAIGASSVAVANGKVFVNCGNALTCLNEDNGVELWSETITGSPEWGSWGSPAYCDGKVYIAGVDLYCFNEDGGPAVWTGSMNSHACNGGPGIGGDYIVAGAWDAGMYHCFNKDTGAPEWTFNVSGDAQGTPAYHDGKFYLTSWEYVGGHVYCVDAATGNQVWHSDGEVDGTYVWDTCGSCCIADGKVFFTTYNFGGYGELLALDATNGNLVWGPKQIERTDSTPAYADGYVYVCGGCAGYSNEGERTYCFDASNGNMEWQTPVALGTGDWTCSVSVADGKVFVGKPDPVNFFDYCGIYALDCTSGSEIWHADHGGASPAIAGGVIYTVGEGKVWAYGSSSSYPAWDLNQDGFIDIGDVAVVGMHWNQTGSPGWIPEDLSPDGIIDIGDIAVIGMHWNE